MNKKYKLLSGTLLLLLGAVLLFWLYFNDPLQSKWTPKCIFYKLSNIYCPGCGATRATYEMLHGNILASLHNNLLLFPLLITAGMLILRPQWSLKRSVAYTIVIAVILFMILRNLPFYPFTLLAPIA